MCVGLGALPFPRYASLLHRPHVDLLQGVLTVLHNICRHAHLLPAVYEAEDCLTVLTERLQFFRCAQYGRQVQNAHCAWPSTLRSPSCPCAPLSHQPAVPHSCPSRFASLPAQSGAGAC
jgi:hypothetical protein